MKSAADGYERSIGVLRWGMPIIVKLFCAALLFAILTALGMALEPPMRVGADWLVDTVGPYATLALIAIVSGGLMAPEILQRRASRSTRR